MHLTLAIGPFVESDNDARKAFLLAAQLVFGSNNVQIDAQNRSVIVTAIVPNVAQAIAAIVRIQKTIDASEV